MIIDRETDYLFLSDLLESGHPRFFQKISKVLRKNGIKFGFLPGTKDIWAVDYMPIQVSQNKFVQFRYEPDYLMKSKKLRATITPVSKVCEKIGIKPVRSDIIIDGGNVVKSKKKVIMTDKIFKENLEYKRQKLLARLNELLEVEEIIIVPQEPGDYLGHTDGMVRFYDEDSVLINDYSKERSAYYTELRKTLTRAKLNLIPIPYNPYQNRSKSSAKGFYINFLEMKGVILLPSFGLKDDEIAVKRFQELFPRSRISVINANEIAKDGGVLHCISWSIKLGKNF